MRRVDQSLYGLLAIVLGTTLASVLLPISPPDPGPTVVQAFGEGWTLDGQTEPEPGPTAMSGGEDTAEPIDHTDPAHDRFVCPVCAPMLLRVEAARLTVTPPVVTRPSASMIVVHGAFYAGTRPATVPIRGEAINLAEIAVSFDGIESIAFEVDPDTQYTVWATVQAADGTNVPFDFTIGVERMDRIVHALAMAIEAEALRNELAPITFIEWVQALDRLRQVEGIQNDHKQRAAISRDHGDGPTREGAGIVGVHADGPEPGGAGSDEGKGPDLE